MSGVPNVFGSATSSIPLSQLDVNFNTPVTIGNTTVGLGNTTITLVGLTNVSTTVVNTSNVSANTSLLLQTNGTTTAVTIDTAQNVGVGVTPSAWGSGNNLELANGKYLAWAGSGLLLQNNYYNGTNNIYKNNGYALAYYMSGGQHQWLQAPSGTAGNVVSFITAMALDTSGNLLVGQNSGSAKISTTGATGNNAFIFTHTTSGDGVGTISQTNTSFASGMVALNAYAAAGTGWNFIQGYSNNFAQNRFNIRGDGNMYNTNGTYGAISDIKLKENISDATPKLTNLMQVRVVNYNFIGDEQKQIGVIAQEIEQIFPSMVDETPDYERVVTTDEDGNEKTERVATGTTTKSVKYSVFVPMLIKAIQELSAQVTTLQTQVAALKAKVGV